MTNQEYQKAKYDLFKTYKKPNTIYSKPIKNPQAIK